MAFWSDHTFEVKRAFRWQITFGSTTSGFRSFYATKVTKPSFTIGETKHHYLSHVFWYPGQITWNDITVTLVDPAGGDNKDMSVVLMKMLGHSGYTYPHDSGEDGLQTIAKSKAAGADALGEISITQFGGNMGGTLTTKGGSAGNVVDQWTLANAWIKEAKFGELDYSSEEMVTIDLTIKYDYAILKMQGV